LPCTLRGAGFGKISFFVIGYNNMTEQYNPKKIEEKWQKVWGKQNLYKSEDFSKKPKKYILVEFPYPSGQGLHTGHCRSYSAIDAIARKKRMCGHNVLFPIGWDAFGLPAENFAIKTGVHPSKTTAQNISNFKRQLKALGISFDWDREINTTDPEYYKHTQWIFLKLFEKGLAYQAEMPINWCPSCKIGLANEEVVAGKCERCGAETEKKIRKQWMLKITDYADRLIDDLDKVDFPERVKTQQINWIGKSCGVEIDFPLIHQQSENGSRTVKVFTTRVDTIFGCTYLVIAPEHPIINNRAVEVKPQQPENDQLSVIDNFDEVKKYIEKSKKKSDLERAEIEKEKTGVELKGIKAINPFNKQEIPIFVADYVLPHYGTGAIMAVPAHDERDFVFGKKYNLPYLKVVLPKPLAEIKSCGIADAVSIYGSRTSLKLESKCWEGEGKLVNSGEFDGMASEKAREEMIKYAEKQGFGKKAVNYKLRDWVFSRQHYWGEPIPLVHCEKCGVVTVPEKDLPVELPYIEKYQPTDTGESPLASISEWVNVRCPKCGKQAKRETDTMPNWAGSSWYYLRYADPQNKKALADKEKLKYWLPVDLYNGGMEHTTLHLLYSRFWHKFLFDIGVVSQDEPYKKRTSHGMVLAEDGRKMSKSFGNVINPDDIIEKYGADSLRLYEMFMGPFEQAIAWNEKGVVGMRRFLEKVWKISSKSQTRNSDDQFEKLTHQTIKKVSEDIENFKFNTAISSLMILVNKMEKEKALPLADYQLLLKLLSPFAPHITEEIWQELGNKNSIFEEKWPEHDDKLIKQKKIILIIQINGKVRDKIETEADISENEAKKLALSREKVLIYTQGKTVKKTIFVSGKLINIVVV
jgi:leucyl-tRNA synthetase